VPFLDHLVGTLHADGYETAMPMVEYQFQRGADRMLVITNPGAEPPSYRSRS
jgi:hypothetical protein